MTPVRRNIRIFKGTAFGPLVINVVDGDGDPVDLTGWAVFSQARKKPTSAAAFDLMPVITDAPGGQITIDPTDEDTGAYPMGDFMWDVVLENPDGVRLPPIVKGISSVEGTATQAA